MHIILVLILFFLVGKILMKILSYIGKILFFIAKILYYPFHLINTKYENYEKKEKLQREIIKNYMRETNERKVIHTT
jgi:cell shape-determining protein MreC